MPDKLEKVQPGDLIEASLYNDLVDRIRGLEDRIGGTAGDLVTVPDLVGQRLGYSADLIQQPNVSLTLGSIYDSFGNSVTPTGADDRARIVVSQMPRPSTEVAKGTTVDLLIAAEVPSNGGDGGPPRVPQPRIDAVTPSPRPIGLPVTIAGANFSTNPSEVTVRIDGEEATPIRNLDADSMEVTVPTSVTNPADNNNQSRDVTVEVTVLGKTASFTGFAVEPPPTTSPPEVDSVDATRYNDMSPGNAREGHKVVIVGDNFAESPGDMEVEFIRSGQSNKTATVEAVRKDVQGTTKDEIDVVIPSFNLAPTQSKAFDFRVKIPSEGLSSPTFDSSANDFFIAGEIPQ